MFGWFRQSRSAPPHDANSLLGRINLDTWRDATDQPDALEILQFGLTGN